MAVEDIVLDLIKDKTPQEQLEALDDEIKNVSGWEEDSYTFRYMVMLLDTKRELTKENSVLS